MAIFHHTDVCVCVCVSESTHSRRCSWLVQVSTSCGKRLEQIEGDKWNNPSVYLLVRLSKWDIDISCHWQNVNVTDKQGT